MNESKLSKKDKATCIIKQNIATIRCPYCSGALLLKEYSLQCENKHTFDMTKKGYLNFATSKGDDHYDRALFEARQAMIEDGLFNTIVDSIHDIMIHYSSIMKHSVVLDVGTGDGAFLSKLQQSLCDHSNVFFGLDLSKEAIALATNAPSEIGWLVGDLANIPMQTNKVDVVLNVFSPANYAEFRRVLNTKGILIKVIPRENHFKEVRDLNDVEPYPQSKTALIKAALQQHGIINNSSRLTYEYNLTNHQQNLISTMSPLSKNKQAVVFSARCITVDVEILVATLNT